jgi:hypothetical protein
MQTLICFSDSYICNTRIRRSAGRHLWSGMQRILSATGFEMEVCLVAHYYCCLRFVSTLLLTFFAVVSARADVVLVPTSEDPAFAAAIYQSGKPEHQNLLPDALTAIGLRERHPDWSTTRVLKEVEALRSGAFSASSVAGVLAGAVGLLPHPGASGIGFGLGIIAGYPAEVQVFADRVSGLNRIDANRSDTSMSSAVLQWNFLEQRTGQDSGAQEVVSELFRERLGFQLTDSREKIFQAVPDFHNQDRLEQLIRDVQSGEANQQKLQQEVNDLKTRVQSHLGNERERLSTQRANTRALSQHLQTGSRPGREAEIRNIRQTAADIRAAGALLGHAFALRGQREEGAKMAAIGSSFATIIESIGLYPDQHSALVAVNGVAGAMSVMIGVLSSNQQGPDPVAEAIASLRQELKALHEELRKSFALVDTKLDKLLDLGIRTYEAVLDLSRGVDSQREAFESARRDLIKSNSAVLQAINNLAHRADSALVRRCINYRRHYSSDPGALYQQCLDHALELATVSARGSEYVVPISMGQSRDGNWFAPTAEENIQIVGHELGSLTGDSTWDLRRNLLNTHVWTVAARMFLQIIADFPARRSDVSEVNSMLYKIFSTAEPTGNFLDRLLAGVAVKDSPLFNLLFQAYESRVKAALAAIDVASDKHTKALAQATENFAEKAALPVSIFACSDLKWERTGTFINATGTIDTICPLNDSCRLIDEHTVVLAPFLNGHTFKQNLMSKAPDLLRARGAKRDGGASESSSGFRLLSPSWCLAHVEEEYEFRNLQEVFLKSGKYKIRIMIGDKILTENEHRVENIPVNSPIAYQNALDFLHEKGVLEILGQPDVQGKLRDLIAAEMWKEPATRALVYDKVVEDIKRGESRVVLSSIEHYKHLLEAVLLLAFPNALANEATFLSLRGPLDVTLPDKDWFELALSCNTPEKPDCASRTIILNQSVVQNGLFETVRDQLKNLQMSLASAWSNSTHTVHKSVFAGTVDQLRNTTLGSEN